MTGGLLQFAGRVSERELERLQDGLAGLLASTAKVANPTITFEPAGEYEIKLVSCRFFRGLYPTIDSCSCTKLFRD